MRFVEVWVNLSIAAFAISVKQSLDHITVSVLEHFELSLSEYFEGNGLSYEVVSSGRNPMRIKDPKEIQLNATFPMEGQSSGASVLREAYPSINLQGITYWARTAGSYVQLYSVTNDTLQFLWTVDMALGPETSVSNLAFASGTQDTYLVAFCNTSEVLAINFTGLDPQVHPLYIDFAWGNPWKMEVLNGADPVLIFLGGSSGSQWISFFQLVFDPLLVRPCANITKYPLFPYDMDVVDIWAEDQVYLLDQSYGLFTLTITPACDIQLEYIGNMTTGTSLRFGRGTTDYFPIHTSTGIFLFSTTPVRLVNFHSFENTEIRPESAISVLTSQFLLIADMNDSDISIVVYRLTGNLVDFFGNFVPDFRGLDAGFGVVDSSLERDQAFFLRAGETIVLSYTLKLRGSKLEGWNATVSESLELSVTSTFPKEEKLTFSLMLYCLPYNYTGILYGQGYSASTALIPYPASIGYFQGNTTTVGVSCGTYFSAVDVGYYYFYPYGPSDIWFDNTFMVPILDWKGSAFSSSLATSIVFGCQISQDPPQILLFQTNEILTLTLNLTSFLSIEIGPNVTVAGIPEVCLIVNDLLLVEVSQDGDCEVLFLDPETLTVLRNVSSEGPCGILKASSSYVLFGNSENLTICPLSLTPCVQLSAATISGSQTPFNISDVAFLRTNETVLVLADFNNGVQTLDFERLFTGATELSYETYIMSCVIPTKLVSQSNFLYILSSNFTSYLIDDYPSLSFRNQFPLVNFESGCETAGMSLNYLYASDSLNFQLINVSAPVHEAQVTSVLIYENVTYSFFNDGLKDYLLQFYNIDGILVVYEVRNPMERDLCMLEGIVYNAKDLDTDIIRVDTTLGVYSSISGMYSFSYLEIELRNQGHFLWTNLQAYPSTLDLSTNETQIINLGAIFYGKMIKFELESDSEIPGISLISEMSQTNISIDISDSILILSVPDTNMVISLSPTSVSIYTLEAGIDGFSYQLAAEFNVTEGLKSEPNACISLSGLPTESGLFLFLSCTLYPQSSALVTLLYVSPQLIFISSQNLLPYAYAHTLSYEVNTTLYIIEYTEHENTFQIHWGNESIFTIPNSIQSTQTVSKAILDIDDMTLLSIDGRVTNTGLVLYLALEARGLIKLYVNGWSVIVDKEKKDKTVTKVVVCGEYLLAAVNTNEIAVFSLDLEPLKRIYPYDLDSTLISSGLTCYPGISSEFAVSKVSISGEIFLEVLNFQRNPESSLQDRFPYYGNPMISPQFLNNTSVLYPGESVSGLILMSLVTPMLLLSPVSDPILANFSITAQNDNNITVSVEFTLNRTLKIVQNFPIESGDVNWWVWLLVGMAGFFIGCITIVILVRKRIRERKIRSRSENLSMKYMMETRSS